MNIQIKQRIVGVIIVGALIALLIPFLFVGKTNKDDTLKLDIPEVQVNPTTAVETPPPLVNDRVELTSNTVEPSLQNEPEKPESLAAQITAPIASTTAPIPTKAEPVAEAKKINQNIPLNPKTETVYDDKSGEDLVVDSLAKTTVEAAAPTSAESIVKQEQNVMSLSPKKHVDKKVKNLKKVKASKSANKSNNRKKTTKIQAKKTTVTAAITTVGTGPWSVYLGDFPENEQGRLIKKMHDSGYRAYAKKTKTPDGMFVGIYVGRLRTHEQAEQLATELQQVTGFSGKTVKTNN